ncbi:hypothetical protein Trydic_g3316 [Trypoxylus dichotomus]
MYENLSNMTDVEIKKAESLLDWSDILLHLIIIGLPFGHFVGMIPAGIFADVFTSKWVFFWGVAISSGVTIIIPLALYRMGYLGIFFLRVVLGMSQSVMFPCVSTLFAYWIPRTERSIVGAILFSSYPVCVILAYFISYVIRPEARLWPNSFYFWGALGALWCLLTRFFLYDYPPKHPRITQEERDYLENKVPRKLNMVGVHSTIHLMVWDTPWQLRDTMGWTTEFANTIVVSTFLGLTVTSTISGIIVYYGLTKCKWDLRWTRRIASLFYVVPNIFAVMSLGPYYASFKVSYLDISLHFPGTIFAIITTISEAVGFMTFVILKNIRSLTYELYCKVNSWLAFFLTFTTIFYYFWRVRVDRAPWDIPLDQEDQYQEELDPTQANTSRSGKVK